MGIRPEDEAEARKLAGVTALAALLAALLLGLGLALGPDRPSAIRVAGGLLVLGAVAGIVVLLRWASGFGWRYDRPRGSASGAEVFLTGVVSVALITVLVEPLRVAGVAIGIAVPFGALIWLRYDRVRNFVLAAGLLRVLSIILTLAAAAYLAAQLTA